MLKVFFFRKSLFNDPCHAPANTEVDQCSGGRAFWELVCPAVCVRVTEAAQPSSETSKFISLVLIVKEMKER